MVANTSAFSKRHASKYPHQLVDIVKHRRQVKFLALGDLAHRRHTLSAETDSSRDPRQIKFGRELPDVGGAASRRAHVMVPRQVKFYVIPDRRSAGSFGSDRKKVARQVKFRSVGDDPLARKWPLGYIVKK